MRTRIASLLMLFGRETTLTPKGSTMIPWYIFIMIFLGFRLSSFVQNLTDNLDLFYLFYLKIGSNKRKLMLEKFMTSSVN